MKISGMCIWVSGMEGGILCPEKKRDKRKGRRERTSQRVFHTIIEAVTIGFLLDGGVMQDIIGASGILSCKSKQTVQRRA